MLSWISASKTEPDSLLLVSAKKGRLDKVISALTNGATVEAKDKDGNTALTNAVIGGFRLIADYLISEKSADVNTRSNDGCTPLMYAASVGHLDILIWLLKKGADIDKKNEDGFTALMWAAYVGNGKELFALLVRGADIEIFNIEGKKAIDLAETDYCIQTLQDKSEFNKKRARKMKDLEISKFSREIQKKK